MGVSYFDVWKKKMISNGGSEVQARINTSKDFFNRNFKNDPSYKLAKLKKRDIPVAEADLDTRIVNVDTDAYKKKIYVRPDTDIEVGDYIKYSNKTYLVLQIEDNLVSPYAESKECNKTIKWMYKGRLYKADTILTNQTKYTLGTDVLSVGFTEGDSRFQIITSYNDFTKTILEGQRMIFNNKAWKVTQTDFVSDVGLISILFGQTSINTETDNVDLEIAGYKESKHTYTWTLPTSTIEVTNGLNYTLSYSIVDETGIEIDYNLVTVKSSDNNLISITKSNKDITIKGLYIGTGTITFDLPVGEIVEEKVINFEVKDVVIPKTEYQIEPPSNGNLLKLMSSSVFAFKQFVGGVENTLLNVGFSLDSVGQTLISQKKLSVTQKTPNSYLVKNLNCSVVTKFTITFTNSSNGDVISTQIITLRGV